MAFYETQREWKPDLTPTEVLITARVMVGGTPHQPGETVICSRQDAYVLVDLRRGQIIGQAGTAE